MRLGEGEAEDARAAAHRIVVEQLAVAQPGRRRGGEEDELPRRLAAQPARRNPRRRRDRRAGRRVSRQLARAAPSHETAPRGAPLASRGGRAHASIVYPQPPARASGESRNKRSPIRGTNDTPCTASGHTPPETWWRRRPSAPAAAAAAAPAPLALAAEATSQNA